MFWNSCIYDYFHLFKIVVFLGFYRDRALWSPTYCYNGHHVGALLKSYILIHLSIGRVFQKGAFFTASKEMGVRVFSKLSVLKRLKLHSREKRERL